MVSFCQTDAFNRQVRAIHQADRSDRIDKRPSDPYFDAHQALAEAEVRALWTAEGKRRGYSMEEA